MKTIIKNFSFVLAIFIMLSCSNNLDEKVYSSVTEQSYKFSEKDFQPIVASIYRYLRDFISHTGFWAAQETTSDEIVMPPNASGWDDGGIYRRMHYHTWNSEQVHIGSMWSAFYRGILICNNVIDQIQNNIVPSPSPNEKEMALAETRAMRAYYYWMVCDNFGDAPLVTTKSSELPSKSTREIFNLWMN